MSILDDFTSYGRYTGKKKEYLSQDNLDRFIAEHGEEWVAGYMKAIEASVVEVSNILQPSADDICGYAATPHMVRKNLNEYWSHNKSLYKCLLNHFEPPSKDLRNPNPE